MQGTRVQSLVGNIPHATGQLSLVPHVWSPSVATTEACTPQEEPPHSEAPSQQVDSSPCSPQLEKAHTATKTQLANHN